ncbi:MAG: carbamoyltransferase HypF [Candidatus Aegiribacteria sp.]
MQRLRMEIKGAVQGVGFRPFVYRLAMSCDLAGWVSNTSSGVVLEVEGETSSLRRFSAALRREGPPLSVIQTVTEEYLEPAGYDAFGIRESTGGRREALVLPDMALCEDCAREILDPDDRRYRYPFTNCTNCGPRYSIIRAIPYDRPATAMSGFRMCPECAREYRDPMDRRFHAQPNACPVCGPHLELWDPDGNVLAERDEALVRSAEEIVEGRIVAVKGLGGFHLMASAQDDGSIAALRERKGRRMKPFAVMCPSMDYVRRLCRVSPGEEELLLSSRAPIVLLRKLSPASRGEAISDLVSPDNPELGVMLPYTPLHLLLLMEAGVTVVATSGNLTDEPICTDEREALARLGGIADLFLVHDRPIARHVDDSIARVFRDEVMMLRRARGYAPMPLSLPREGGTVLAAGAHLKNTLALSVGRNVFISQHIGDLETPQALEAFDEVLESTKALYGAAPDCVACDMHPDYLSSRRARETGLEVLPVQHHLAHIYSLMLDSGAKPPLLGVAWDGTGYGSDGTVWGGEFFHFTHGGNRRIARFRHFPLPGGDAAVKEPRRSALGILGRIFPEPEKHLPPGTFSDEELRTLKRMMDRGFNSPLTSSTGRLFDGVASILGLHQKMEFEAQAAMALEHAMGDIETGETYPFTVVDEGGIMVIDWAPMVSGILEDLSGGFPRGLISAKFHCTLSHVILNIAERTGEENVLLSGGCFQNRSLLEMTCRILEEGGYRAVVHRSLPANDGGIAPGQVMAAITAREETDGS